MKGVFLFGAIFCGMAAAVCMSSGNYNLAITNVLLCGLNCMNFQLFGE